MLSKVDAFVAIAIVSSDLTRPTPLTVGLSLKLTTFEL